MVLQSAVMDMGNMLARRHQRLDHGTEPAKNDDMAQRPMKGCIVSPVEHKKTAHKTGNHASLRDASNTMDAHSPRVSAQRPTAKEIAAARAARIRLGYEVDDTGSKAEAVAPKLPDGPEPTPPAQIDYVPLHSCQPCQDVQAAAQEVECGLKASNWIKACESLTMLQRLVAHHSDVVIANLDQLAPLLVKHVQSLRSQVGKIAILVYGDMLSVLGDHMLPHIDGAGMGKPSQSPLCQLLLKSVSKDKKFVLEAAQQVLRICCDTLDAREVTLKLLPYAKHKNPAVRGAAAEALLAAVRRVGVDRAALAHLGGTGLLQAGAALLTDKAPAARTSSRQVVQLLKECVEEQAGLERRGDVSLTKEPSSDQENTLCGEMEQLVLPVRGYATRSAVAAARAAAAAASESAPAPPAPIAVHAPGKAAPRRLSARKGEDAVDARRQSIDSSSAGAGAAAWDALCAEVLSASEMLAVSRLMRTEAAAE